MKFLILACLIANVASEKVLLGKITNYDHGVQGVVYAYNATTIIVEDFEYDGAGPDAFFWVGNTDSVGTVGTILPYPFEGKFYEYEDNNAPILKGRFDKEKIVLTLPKDISNYKWISVWCRAFKVNFGDLFFPDNLNIEEEGEGEGEPEGEAELPSPIDSHHNHLDGNHNDDPDAESEAESEANSETEPGHPEAEGSSSLHRISGLATAFSILVIIKNL